jgi:hypothetical protein
VSSRDSPSISAFFVAISAAPAIDIDTQFRELLPASDIPHAQITLFGLTRGAWYFAWALPLFLGYLTFANRPGDPEPDLAKYPYLETKRFFRLCLAASLGFQILATIVIIYNDGVIARITAPIDSYASPGLPEAIEQVQLEYGIMYVGTLLIGYLAIGTIWIRRIMSRTYQFVLVACALLVTSLVFLQSQSASHQLNHYYPGARNNESVTVFVDAERNVTYTRKFLNRLGGEFRLYETAFICDPASIGEFLYVAIPTTAIAGQRVSIGIVHNSYRDLLFCPHDR